MRALCKALSFLAILALTAAPALADELVSFKAGYLTLAPEGEFAVFSNGVGTKIDMDDDLGFDDSQELMAEATLQLGALRLSAGYLPLQFTGAGTLSRTVFFNGQTFNPAVAVAGEVEIDIYDVGLTWQLINLDDLPIRLQLGPELSVKYVETDLSLNSIAGTGESESGSAPLPTIGLRARVGLADFLALVGRVGYLEYNDNSYLDADAQLEFSPIPLAGLFAGYRYFDVNVDESDIFLDVQLSGPYGGAFVRF